MRQSYFFKSTKTGVQVFHGENHIVDGTLLNNNIIKFNVDVVKVSKHKAEKRLKEYQVGAIADVV